MRDTRAALADADAVIARVRQNIAPDAIETAALTIDALAIAEEWACRVEQLAERAARESRRLRRERPSVTARLMAQSQSLQSSPTGQAA
jgi:glycogen debranching enzyme